MQTWFLGDIGRSDGARLSEHSGRGTKTIIIQQSIKEINVTEN